VTYESEEILLLLEEVGHQECYNWRFRSLGYGAM